MHKRSNVRTGRAATMHLASRDAPRARTGDRDRGRTEPAMLGSNQGSPVGRRTSRFRCLSTDSVGLACPRSVSFQHPRAALDVRVSRSEHRIPPTPMCHALPRARGTESRRRPAEICSAPPGRWLPGLSHGESARPRPDWRLVTTHRHVDHRAFSTVGRFSPASRPRSVIVSRCRPRCANRHCSHLHTAVEPDVPLSASTARYGSRRVSPPTLDPPRRPAGRCYRSINPKDLVALKPVGSQATSPASS